MNYQMPHDEWEEKIIARFAGDLDPSEFSSLDNHVQSCALCAQELKEYALLASCLTVIENDEPALQLPPAMQTLSQEIALHKKIQEEAQRIAEEAFREKEQEEKLRKMREQLQNQEWDQRIGDEIPPGTFHGQVE